MRWTDRQQAMLREIGIRLWLPAQEPVAAEAALLPAQEPVPAETALLPAQEPVAAETALRGPGVAPAEAGLAAEGLARLEWPALVERAAGCTACALCAGRTRSVFEAGHRRADWMVIGDAPDDADDDAGVPFSGAAGQLLDNMLAAIRVTRGEATDAVAYVTTAVKCRPPVRRAPEAGELRCCEPFLERQLQLVRPRMLLALGRVAAHALLRSEEPFGKLRGRVHRYGGVPLVVTHHPAHLLRHPEDKAAAWHDLCLALGTLQQGERPAA